MRQLYSFYTPYNEHSGQFFIDSAMGETEEEARKNALRSIAVLHPGEPYKAIQLRHAIGYVGNNLVPPPGFPPLNLSRIEERKEVNKDIYYALGEIPYSHTYKFDFKAFEYRCKNDKGTYTRTIYCRSSDDFKKLLTHWSHSGYTYTPIVTLMGLK